MTATVTNTSLSATWTQASLFSALQTAFTNAGYSSPYDNYTSGTDLILVYAFPVDNTKTYGTNYLRVRLSNTFILYQQLYTGWNNSTHVGTNGSTEVTIGTLSNTINVNFASFNGGSEYKLIFLTQNANLYPLGMVCPATMRSSWNLNSYPWGFIFTSSSLNTLRSASLTPYSSTDFDTFLNNARLATACTIDNQRDGFTGIPLLTQSNTGIAGYFSSDFASVSASGSSRYDVFVPPGTSQQYSLINNVSGGLAIRIA